jgi:hypothetical protein
VGAGSDYLFANSFNLPVFVQQLDQEPDEIEAAAASLYRLVDRSTPPFFFPSRIKDEAGFLAID